MSIQLIDGQFTGGETMELITQMIQVKIKFHERKIHSSSSEEDIKMREMKIRNLHKELYNIKDYLKQVAGNITIHSEIILNH